MEHILISPGKLKLMLTRDDLARYELTDASVSEGSRGAFKLLLEDAGRLTGFDAGDDKLFIQLYPSKDGGAEVYITRLGGLPPEKLLDDRLRLERAGAFESLAELLHCAKALKPALEDSEYESSAWHDCGRYFLVISENLTCHDYLERASGGKIENIIGEFGQIVRSMTAICCVKEHSFNFCEKNAVKILASMV